MLTSALVTLLLEELGAGWSRQRILEALNDVQNEEMAIDIDLLRVKPDPFVATTDAIYSYAASSYLYDSATGAQGSLVGDIRAVRKIYRLPASSTLDNLTPLDPTSDKPQFVDYDPDPQRIVARVDFIDSVEPNSTDAMLKWWEQYNPGTTTITWRAQAYKWPTQLTTEDIAMTMPADFHRTLMLWGCLRHMERREYGRVDPAQHDAERRRFRSKCIARTGQDLKGFAAPRPC